MDVALPAPATLKRNR